MSVRFSRVHRRVGLSSWRRLRLGVDAFCSAVAGAGVRLPVFRHTVTRLPSSLPLW